MIYLTRMLAAGRARELCKYPYGIGNRCGSLAHVPPRSPSFGVWKLASLAWSYGKPLSSCHLPRSWFTLSVVLPSQITKCMLTVSKLLTVATLLRGGVAALDTPASSA